jgi:hypothetical protein
MKTTAIEKIKSTSLPTQIEGFEEAITELSEFYDCCIDVLENAPDKLFIAERIFKMRYLFDEKLKILFEAPNSTKENRLYAASLLYQSHSKESPFEQFLAEIADQDDWANASFALLKLRQQFSQKATPIIIKKLELADVSELDKVSFLIDSLEQLKVELPIHLQLKYTEEKVAWQIRFRASKRN